MQERAAGRDSNVVVIFLLLVIYSITTMTKILQYIRASFHDIGDTVHFASLKETSKG